LFRTDPERAAACFLYEEAPALAEGAAAPLLAATSRDLSPGLAR
jgi:hypothetical protein